MAETNDATGPKKDGSFELFTSLRYDPLLLSVPTRKMEHAGWNFENKSSLYMLDFHRDRILRAATHWGWQPAIDVLVGDDGIKRLADYVANIIETTQTQDVPQRIRIILTKDGVLRHEALPVAPTTLNNLLPTRLPPPGAQFVPGDPEKTPSYQVVVDKNRTDRSEFTHFKTTCRMMYDSARARASISLTDLKEVLINDRTGSVMEGSVTTPYFWRNGRWITPPVSKGFSTEKGSGGQDGSTRRWALERLSVGEEEINVDSLVDGEECWISNGVRGFCYGSIKITPPK